MHMDSEIKSTLRYDFMRYMNAVSLEMSDEPKNATKIFFIVHILLSLNLL